MSMAVTSRTGIGQGTDDKYVIDKAHTIVLRNSPLITLANTWMTKYTRLCLSQLHNSPSIARFKGGLSVSSGSSPFAAVIKKRGAERVARLAQVVERGADQCRITDIRNCGSFRDNNNNRDLF